MAAKGNVFDQYKCIEVYDALDSGQYGVAVNKADALLASGPFPLARALKTVALFRQHRHDEAEREVDQLLGGSVDLNVLSPLGFVLPRMGKAKQLADLYMAASQAHPQDEELADGALLVLIKAGMFQRALQLILKRFRTSKDPRDFWRYVQVAVLHAQHVKPPSSKLTLDVALRLIKEQKLNEHSFTPETLSLYLHFFSLLDHTQLREALDLLTKPPIQDMVDKNLGIQFQVRECWKALEDQDSLLNDCRTRIQSGDRNWAVISQFVSSSVARGSLAEEDVTLLLHAAAQDEWRDRGSFLGVLELCRLALDAKQSLPDGVDYANLVTNYVERFASKLTCFDDIRPHLAALHKTPDVPHQPLTSETSITQRINAEKIALFFEQGASADDLLQAYIESLEHVHEPSTEMQPGDDLALLAVYVTLAKSSSVENLIQAAAIASYACEKSARAYKLRLLLIRLLLRLGCLKLAVYHFDALELKAVQLDTMPHYLLDRNASFGGSHAADVGNHWEGGIKDFYELSAFEVPEALGRAFLNGKFSQVSDLCDFYDCVEGSYARLILLVDMLCSKFVTQDLVDSERDHAVKLLQYIFDMIQADRLSDQRDTHLLPWINETQKTHLESVLSCGPLRKKQWLKAMLEILSVALPTPSAPTDISSDVLTGPEGALLDLARALREGTNLAAPSFFEQMHTYASQATAPFEMLHAAWTGIMGLRLLEAVGEGTNKDIKDLLGPVAGSALSNIHDLLIKEMDKNIHVNLIERLGASGLAFIQDVDSGRKDALKDALRPYQAVLRTIA